jgi:uncharacterized protein (DUF58 family)
VAGDDPRLIRWRLSAKTGSLLVADRAADESRRIEIRIDNRVAAAAARPEEVSREETRIEREISRAAWLVLDSARSGAATIRIVTAEGGIGPSPASRSRSLLAFLALLPVLRAAPAEAAAQVGRGGRITTRRSLKAPAADPGSVVAPGPPEAGP